MKIYSLTHPYFPSRILVVEGVDVTYIMYQDELPKFFHVWEISTPANLIQFMDELTEGKHATEGTSLTGSFEDVITMFKT